MARKPFFPEPDAPQPSAAAETPAPAETKSVLPVGPKCEGGSHLWDPVAGKWVSQSPAPPAASTTEN